MRWKRLHLMQRLKSRYGQSIKEILQYCKRLSRNWTSSMKRSSAGNNRGDSAKKGLAAEQLAGSTGRTAVGKKVRQELLEKLSWCASSTRLDCEASSTGSTGWKYVSQRGEMKPLSVAQAGIPRLLALKMSWQALRGPSLVLMR